MHHRARWKTLVFILKKLFQRVRYSRLIDYCRSSDRHARHILKHGYEAWRYLSDIGLNGSVEEIRFYYQSSPKFDINCYDRRKNTMLIQAARANNYKCLMYLLHLPGIDISQKNNERKTALIVALESRAVQCVALLAQYGAVRDAERQRLYPLHVLCESDYFHIESLAILLYYGANLNSIQRGVGTPLQLAIRKENRPLAYLLLRLGAKLLQGTKENFLEPEDLFPDAITNFSRFEKELKSALEVAMKYLQDHFLRLNQVNNNNNNNIQNVIEYQRYHFNRFLYDSSNDSSLEINFIDRLISIGAIKINEGKSYPSKSFVVNHPSFSGVSNNVSNGRQSFLTLADLSYWFPSCRI